MFWCIMSCLLTKEDDPARYKMQIKFADWILWNIARRLKLCILPSEEYLRYLKSHIWLCRKVSGM